MQPAYLFAVISLALSPAPPATEPAPPAGLAVPGAHAGDASEADGLITGSTPVIRFRVTGEPLSCEAIRLMDEVELVADESYCG